MDLVIDSSAIFVLTDTYTSNTFFTMNYLEYYLLCIIIYLIKNEILIIFHPN